MDLSLKELDNFAKWMNEIIGYQPTIIGGWAVYFHNPTLGSIDIDVVLPTWEMRDRIINKYLKSNGYELREKAFGETEWVKLLEPDNPDSDTYLDVCTLQDKNLVHGKDTEIPWSIALNWQKSKKVKSGEIYIPDPEPLLVLKVKAAWDRSYDIEKSSESPFLKDKLSKDRIDIISLISNCDMKLYIINEIVLKYDFKECFEETLGRTISDQTVLDRLDLKPEDKKDLKKKIKEIIDNLD